MLVVFGEEARARQWAVSLEAFRDTHGAYPPREFATEPPEAFAWLRTSRFSGSRELRDLEVADMAFSEVVGMMRGTGLHCRLLMDDRVLDIRHAFDVHTVRRYLERGLATD